ncbi:peptide ligase PGM1-related protein [Rubrivirga sp. IMCC43871]|uniref:peptide ligase PGM1-related protein n=1 Tax=Rubrivirga sp. IMCC43871 TaxID=3391575 RepID=UPI00398FC0D0
MPVAPPLPATPPDERAAFAALQASFRGQFERVFPDRLAPRTVVVVPSLTMPPDELAKIDGVHHYEERMLFTLMLLRLPHTRLVFVTSQPVAPGIVDYYLHLLPGIPAVHARERLKMLACHDASPIPLLRKVLDLPRLVHRIRDAIRDVSAAHLTCFNATALERTLAVRLGIPLYACDPDLAHLGTKSGSRKTFRAAGVDLPDGAEDLRDLDDAADALAALKGRDPGLRRAVVKLNDGFSGEGNAVVSFEGAPGEGLAAWVRRELPGRLRFEAATETVEHYAASFAAMGGVVEAFVDGEGKVSPSVQCRIDPVGRASVISTHDQILGGPSGQVFLGCTFPAAAAYRQALHDAGERVADQLAAQGVLGRFGVDFVSVPQGDGWRHVAIEINLRKGGTTHPFDMLEYLTDGTYDEATGLYRTPSGEPRAYVATDNLVREAYRGLTPRDLIDLAVDHRLHFHGATQEGVVFHLIGALSEFGKVGLLCIGRTPARARQFYDETVRVLDAGA